MDKIIFLLIIIIPALGIYTAQFSHGTIRDFHLYPLKTSNDILAISVDNSTYKQGETVQIAGTINTFNEGARVNIKILSSDQTIVSDSDALLNRDGIFREGFLIPQEFSNGQYTIKAYYKGDLKRNEVSLEITINNGLSEVYVNIPFGASSGGNKIGFDPPIVKTQEQTKIVWINNDNTIHTVISGKSDEYGNMSPNGVFESGLIPPQENFEISLKQGNYQYFCKLHPWLVGFIAVSPNPSNNQIPKPSKITQFPVSNSTLVSVWKDRSDLQKAYPEVAKGNLTKLKNWATKTGWNEDKRLAALIPPGKVPSYLQKGPFPVSNSTLVSVWKDRSDLQKSYPEVAKGNLTKLQNWAATFGWNEDKRLVALIPPGKVPAYTQLTPASPFPISNSTLVSVWKDRSDLQKAFPEVKQGNLDNLKKWAKAFGWNEDKRLAALIPPGKVPSYPQKGPFPVSNSTLVSVWKDRSDLQKSYPEVAKGNLTKLQNWAATFGWNEDKRLAALIPSGKVPSYLQSPPSENETSFNSNANFTSILPILFIVVVISIGGVFGYRFYCSHKKINTRTY